MKPLVILTNHKRNSTDEPDVTTSSKSGDAESAITRGNLGLAGDEPLGQATTLIMFHFSRPPQSYVKL